VKTVGASVIAIAASFLLILGFNFIGTQTPQSRIEAVVHEAYDANQLEPLSNLNNDLFTECGLFAAELVRDKSVVRDITASVLPHFTSHPCDTVGFHIAGQTLETGTTFRYHYGSRHLFAVLARFMGIEAMRSLIGFLGIAAPLALGIAFFIRVRSEVLAMSPLILTLVVGFGYTNLGRNLAHAPGFVIPLLMLSGVVWCRSFFVPASRRFAAYASIASIATYFDILSGPLPFILAVTLIVNHFTFNSGRNDNCWIRQSAVLCVLFLGASVFIIGLKLALVAIVFQTNPLRDFGRELTIRMSSVNDSLASITRGQLILQLWGSRALSFLGALPAASLFYISGALCWGLSAILLAARRGERYREVSVLAMGSLVVLLWYMIFLNHSYVHHQFMARIGVLPAAAGIMALVVLSNGWLAIAGVAIVPIVGVIALQTLSLVPQISEVQLEPDALRADFVSCSNELTLRRDGKPDIVWRIALDGSRFFRTRLSGIRIYRINPAGVFSTNPGSFPAAILSTDGNLLSHADRTINVAIGRRKELLIAFCDDGGATPQTRFNITAFSSQGESSTTIALHGK